MACRPRRTGRAYTRAVTKATSKTISVVISTYQRPDACEAALRSVLAQTESPVEILVCDDGSTDETAPRMREWERREELVRYLRAPHNSGTPATTRNLGIEHARGDLVAFLDDDDEWLPSKLASQRSAMLAEKADLVATNALRSDGSLYFPDAPAGWHPTRLDVLKANPIIMSSALVRRDLLLSAGGFPQEIRLRALEDYAVWLELAWRGAALLILGEALVRYDDASSERLSTDRTRIQVAMTRLAWRYALDRPVKPAAVKAALRHSLGVGHVVAVDSLAALRARAGTGSRR
jgi:glycosyltransferase involved in cell wall biosynthesis